MNSAAAKQPGLKNCPNVQDISKSVFHSGELSCYCRFPVRFVVLRLSLLSEKLYSILCSKICAAPAGMMDVSRQFSWQCGFEGLSGSSSKGWREKNCVNANHPQSKYQPRRWTNAAMGEKCYAKVNKKDENGWGKDQEPPE